MNNVAYNFYCEHCHKPVFQPEKPRILNPKSWWGKFCYFVWNAYSWHPDYICEKCFYNLVMEPVE